MVQFIRLFPQNIKLAHKLRENIFKMRPPASVSNQHKRWSQNSAAAQCLRVAIIKGDVELSEQPKTIYDSNPIFLDHTLDSVRAYINKLRTKDGQAILEKGK